MTDAALAPELETLYGLVSHFSPTGAERPAADWLAARCQQLGYRRAYVDEVGNAVALMGSGPRQIVLLGHIDTVPGEIPVRLEDGVLYGRGSVDAKGPLAAFVDAAARLGPVPDWQLVVVGAVDEEGDSRGARHVAPRYQPEYALIGEPSGWERVTLGYKGSAWSRITVRQPLAHTAGQGGSAPEAAVAIWGRVLAWAKDFNAGRERIFEQVSPSLLGLASGDDGFEAWAQLRLGVRLPPDLDAPGWYAALGELAGEAQVEQLGTPVPAYRAEKNTPLVRAFLAGIRKRGGKPGFVLKSGTADLNLVAPRWNCPAVAYGPGDSALDHTPNEHISVVEYLCAVEVLVAALDALLNAGGN